MRLHLLVKNKITKHTSLVERFSKGRLTEGNVKRVGNLFDKIISVDNLLLADQKARRGKSARPDVQRHMLHQEERLLNLHQQLSEGTYVTSPYSVFKIKDTKERDIYSLPYYPDRIVHHAIMNYLEPVFLKCFVKGSYNCIRGRGIHKASYDLRKVLHPGDYCLKLDVQKFYPSVDHNVLIKLLWRKIKDKRLMSLLEEIIKSTSGLPIGSYLSQFLANFYLTYFDYWVKQQLCVKHYFRYCDDIVIVHQSKEYLHNLFHNIRGYLNYELKLEVKSNYQVFPVESRGIDWVGYKHYATHTLLRKRIKQKYKKSKNKFNYNGWLTHAHCFNLRQKYESNS